MTGNIPMWEIFHLVVVSPNGHPRFAGPFNQPPPVDLLSNFCLGFTSPWLRLFVVGTPSKVIGQKSKTFTGSMST